MKGLLTVVVSVVLTIELAAVSYLLRGAQAEGLMQERPASGFDQAINDNAERMMKGGQQTFRFDTP